MFELYTLVDITESKARRGEDPLKFSQQQNFLTMLNTIGLRANPTIIKTPTVVDNFPKFGSLYKDAKHAWRFVFDIEYGAHSLDMLKDDFMLVPFVAGLKEDCVFDVAAFETKNNKTKNIVFKQMDK